MSLVCCLVEKFLNFLSIVNGKKIRFVAAWSACLVEKKKFKTPTESLGFTVFFPYLLCLFLILSSEDALRTKACA
jgi:hypothetical protein